MKWLWHLLLMFLGQEVKRRAFSEGRRVATLTYLRAVRAVRRATLFSLVVFFAFNVLLLSGFGVLICGVLLWEPDPHRQLQILFGAFVVLFALPFVTLSVLLSERMWFRASGADRLVKDLTEK